MAGAEGDPKARGLAMRVEQRPPPEAKEQKKIPETGVSRGLVDKLTLKIPDMPATPELELPVDNRVGMFSNSKRSEGIKGNSDRYELKVGGGEKAPQSLEDPLPPRLAALMPGPQGGIGRIEGGPFADHVEGVEEGEGTFLNAREYRYASFFNRVKKEVSMRWDPGVQLVKRDPTGGIYGQKDRLTILHVVLDEKGGLRKAEVAQGSGLDFLDQEAIGAFERAQPFPNPPTGLLKDGQISFNFGFFVEFSSSSFRMFRAN
jgi:TonB family protein